MLSLAHIIERNAQLSPDAPAVKCGDTQLTTGELAIRVRILASALHANGVQHHDRISVLSMNSADFLVCYLAAAHAGVILNTINFRLSLVEMAWILDDASPRLLIFEAQYAAVVDKLRAQLDGIERYVCIGAKIEIPAWAESFEAFLESGTKPAPAIVGTADDACCLMYTSGTTGKPKGVVHVNRSLMRVAEVLSSELGLNGTTRLLAVAPLFHMGAATLSLAALFRGGCVVLHRAFDSAAVIHAIEHERITAIHLVPTMVQSILDAPCLANHDLSSLKILMYAAAPMPLPVLKRAVAQFGAITYNGYGQTEINMLTLLHPHQHHLDGSEEMIGRLASVGQAHWQCQLRIIDDQGRELPSGDIGEVAAKSETAMLGYWNNVQATQAALQDGWIRTGDLGYLDREGYLFLVDRKKDVIISGGENIYSREVEDTLAAHPAVFECAVIGVPDAKWGEAVHAVVVLNPGASVTAEALIAWSRARIAGFKIPKKIEFIASLPRLSTGKISKVELRARFAHPATV